MGANAKGRGTHIAIVLDSYSPVSAPNFGSLLLPQRWSDQNKNTSLHVHRSGSVCYYFSLSLLKRNSGKLGKTGKISNGKMH